jgi:hypothetical protein
VQQNIRYYITKADDQPVVRSVPVMRPYPRAIEPRPTDHALPDVAAKPSVSSLLRLALRRSDERVERG